jgi:DNA-binding transcriptional ArsR family regulator
MAIIIDNDLGEERHHPVNDTASELERYLGIKCDLIHMTILMSVAGGCMVMPVPVEIFSNSPSADVMVTLRIFDLVPGRVRRVDTHKQFRELEKRGFAGLAAILIRGTHRTLFRDTTEYTAGLGVDVYRLPSVIRITDRPSPTSPIPHTLCVMAAQAERDLDDFPHSFATFKPGPGRERLAALLMKLPVEPDYPCAFRDRFKGSADSGSMLVFERILLLITAIRVHHPDSLDRRPYVGISDYRCARALLTNLPLSPIGTSVSAKALETAEVIYEALKDAKYQRSVPGRSAEGNKWFRRSEAMNWTGLSYTAVKYHLTELEDEGLLRSTLAETDRRQGREIHYRFIESRAPPFAWRNPFASLPEAKEIPET